MRQGPLAIALLALSACGGPSLRPTTPAEASLQRWVDAYAPRMDSLERHRAIGLTDAFDARDVRDDVVDGAGGLAVLEDDTLYVLDGRRLCVVHVEQDTLRPGEVTELALDPDQLLVDGDDVVVVGSAGDALAVQRFVRERDRLRSRGLTLLSIVRPALFRARAVLGNGQLGLYLQHELVRGRPAFPTLRETGDVVRLSSNSRPPLDIAVRTPRASVEAPHLHVWLRTTLEESPPRWRGQAIVAGAAAWSRLTPAGVSVWTRHGSLVHLDASGSEARPVAARFVAASGEHLLVDDEGVLREAGVDGAMGAQSDPRMADARVRLRREGWYFGSPGDVREGCALDGEGLPVCRPPEVQEFPVETPSGTRPVPHDVARLVALPDGVVVFGSHDDEGRGTWLASDRGVRVDDVGWRAPRAGDVAVRGTRLALAAESGTREARASMTARPAVVFVWEDGAAVVRGHHELRAGTPVRGFLLGEDRALAVVGVQVVLGRMVGEGLLELARLSLPVEAD